MDQGLVRLILLVLVLLVAGCASRTPEPASLSMPARDPLAGSPAMTLVQSAQRALHRGAVITAGERLERALTLVPNSSWLYRLLAQQRLRRDKAASAEGFVRRALRYAPRARPYYRAALRELLATTLARQGLDEAATRAREKAQALRQH